MKSFRMMVAVLVVAALATLSLSPIANARSLHVSLPVPRAATNLPTLKKPHHDHPSADIPVPVGTTVFAVVGGKVTFRGWAGECGYAIQVTRGNTVYMYCHGKGTFFAKVGATVSDGDRLMLSGNTGSSTGPHLHLQIKVNGVLRCPQPLLVAAWKGQPYDPQQLPRSGCTY